MKKRAINFFLLVFVLIFSMSAQVEAVYAEATNLATTNITQAENVQVMAAMCEEPTPNTHLIPYVMIIVSTIMIGFTAIKLEEE